MSKGWAKISRMFCGTVVVASISPFVIADDGVCEPRIPVGQFCTASGQCVVNAECQTPSGGLCICNPGYFPTGNQGDACAAYKLPGSQCLSQDRYDLGLN